MDNASQPESIPQQVTSVQQPSAGPSKTFLFAIVLVLLVGVGAGAYFFGIKNAQPVTQPVTTAPIVAKPTPTVDPTANWQTYTNSDILFSFKYPQEWSRKDLQDKGKVNGVDVQGQEGTIHAVWGSGFGGGCPQGYVDIEIQNEKLSACNRGAQADGSYIWQAGKQLSNEAFGVLVTANAPYATNKNIMLQVLSTFTFTDQSQTSTSSSSTTLSVGQFVKEGQVQQLTIPGGMTFTKPADWTVIAPAPSFTSTFIVQVSTTVPKKVDNIIVSINKYNYDGKSKLTDWYNNTLSSDHGGEVTGMQPFGTTSTQALVVEGDGQATYTTYYVIYKTNVFGIVVVTDFDAHNNQEATDFLNSVTFAN